METRQLLDTLMAAIDGALVDLHTATIAKITAVNTTTVDCQPVINRHVDGQSIQLPEFIDVPPLFLQGGGSYTAHPIAVGDYALLIFTERCFDRWYNGADFQLPLEARMHDYSDGFALVGVNPLSGAITIPSVIQQTGDTNQDGAYTHQGTMTRTGDTEITGNVEITGTLTVNGAVVTTSTLAVAGQMSTPTGATIAGIEFGAHTHTENDVGGETSGPN